MKFKKYMIKTFKKESLPSRERGLKLYCVSASKKERCVAPLAGAWIEMMTIRNVRCLRAVAPLAGAWIEIIYTRTLGRNRPKSLPSRERGLKFEEYAKKGGRVASLPSRERGLKLRSRMGYCYPK